MQTIINLFVLSFLFIFNLLWTILRVIGWIVLTTLQCALTFLSFFTLGYLAAKPNHSVYDRHYEE
jgi:hypothetical protein